jgi:hypothetical protein
VVYAAAATDVQGGTVTYAISGADAAAFTIDPATGAVTFNTSPDFETKSSYSFTVKASDPSGAFNIQAVTLNVTDVAPTVTSATSVSVPNGTSTATVFYTAAGTDAGGGTVTFSLSGADAAAFTIDNVTGAVTFNAVPDAAVKSSYAFNVVASDGTLTSSQAVSISVGQPPAQAQTPPQQPAEVVLPGGPQQAAAPIPPSVGLPPVQVQGSAPGALVFNALVLGQPVDRTVSASNLNPNFVADRAFSVPTVADLNTLPATAAGPSDLVGFPVERVGMDVAPRIDSGLGLLAGGHRLFVYHGIPDMDLTPDGSGTLRVPQDAFAHTDPSAIVHLDARLTSGLPLPSWLKFEGVGGSFRGLPPAGLLGSLEIEVIARDTDGREAHTKFVLQIEDLAAMPDARVGDVADIMLGLDVDSKEAEKARLEAARQAPAPRSKAGGPADKAQKQPAASFTDQLRAAKGTRDPLLDRIAGTGPEKPGPRG